MLPVSNVPGRRGSRARGPARPAGRLLGAALGCALLLAACGGATKTVVTRSSAPHTASTASAPANSGAGSSRTATTTPTRTATTAPRTSTTATVPACTAPMLRLSYLGGQGATGHGLLGFALTNRTSHACHTYGFPGVEFLSASGAALPTTFTRTTRDFFGSVAEQKITLAPGQSASFRVGVSDQSTGGGSKGCATAAALQVIPPDDTRTLRVAIANGGAYQCGQATVTPLLPGDSAYRG